MRSLPALCVLLVAAALPSSASASIREPDGLQVPTAPSGGETSLLAFFQGRSEAVDWQADAHTTPGSFAPLCSFRASFLLHQSPSGALGLGWYNETGQLPAAADIHVVVPPGSAVSTAVTDADIRSNPAYTGGMVGFALLGGQTHYTSQQWNPFCSACTPIGPWDLSLMYRSATLDNAYYVAFEDGAATASAFNNDGDFNDDVFLLEGVTCSGGGQYCNTGKLGVCAPGLTRCAPTGVVCQQNTQADVETCNGLDDDCNGVVDDGAPCPGTQVCSRGACVERCTADSCGAGQVCGDRGTCEDSACAAVSCPANNVCTAGTCRAQCEGVTCPSGQICRNDRCVDPCAGVTCASGSVCDRGTCVLRCDCRLCPGGTSCDSASGACIEPACIGVTCGAGTACLAGRCEDSCRGAICPPGQTCTLGQCVAPAAPDAGGPDAGVADAGTADAGAADAGETDGGAMDAGPGGTDAGQPAADGEPDAGAPPPDGGTGGDGHPDTSGGCGCAGAGPGLLGAWAGALWLALALARRRFPSGGRAEATRGEPSV